MSERTRPSRRAKRSIHPDRDPVGSDVRDRRRTENLAQVVLAELAGVSPRVVWELEHGKSTMRMDVVNRVLGVFGKELGVVDAPRPEIDE
jgi:predicted transcriptional regulator